MKKATRAWKYEVGVDEAGRGPLAGPVAVGVAVVPKNFDWKLLAGVGDSKKVSPKNREAIFRAASTLRRAHTINFSVALVSHQVIDRIGITRAVLKGIDTCFRRLGLHPDTAMVKLDGHLSAPVEFTMQETIVQGDAKEKVIGLASILAKVTRDQHMLKLSGDHPAYSFDVHKGYGTKAHLEAIKRYGLSPVHRQSFCRAIMK